MGTTDGFCLRGFLNWTTSIQPVKNLVNLLFFHVERHGLDVAVSALEENIKRQDGELPQCAVSGLFAAGGDYCKAKGRKEQADPNEQ